MILFLLAEYEASWVDLSLNPQSCYLLVWVLVQHHLFGGALVPLSLKWE